MQLIAEAYDLLRQRARRHAGRDRRHLPRLERGRPRVVPDRDHRRRARATGRRDRQARSSTSCSTRPSRRAPAAGPCRARSTSASRSPASPRRRSPGRCPATPSSAPPAQEAFGAGADDLGVTRPGRVRRGRAPRAVRVEGRRLRAGLRPHRRRHGTNTTGTSTAARWRRSGAAAASSGPASSTASTRPTTTTPTCRHCSSRRTSPTPCAAASTPGGGSSRRRRPRASRRPRSPRRSPTTTGCAATGCPAALIQGLRDNFGAHTYRRVDKDGSFHTEWAGDKLEHEASRSFAVASSRVRHKADHAKEVAMTSSTGDRSADAESSKHHRAVTQAAVLTAVGGILFGYDTGVVGGVLPNIADDVRPRHPVPQGARRLDPARRRRRRRAGRRAHRRPARPAPGDLHHQHRLRRRPAAVDRSRRRCGSSGSAAS